MKTLTATTATTTPAAPALRLAAVLFIIHFSLYIGAAPALRAQLTPAPSVFTDWTGAVDNNWFNPGNWSTGLVPDGADVAVRLRGESAIPNKHIHASYTGIGDHTIQLYSLQTGANLGYTLEFSGNEDGWLILNPVGKGFTFNGFIGTEMGSSYDITNPNSTGDNTLRLAMNVTLNSYTRLTLEGSSAAVRVLENGLSQGLFTLKGNAQMDVSQSGGQPFIYASGTYEANRTATVQIGGLQTDPGTVVYVGARVASINSRIPTGETSVMSGLFYGDNTGNANCDVYGYITQMNGIVNFAGDGRATFRIRSSAQYYVDGVHNGNIAVWSGATAGGSGIINGAVSVLEGGQLTPARKGSAADAPLTINGNVDLSGNLSFDMITDTLYDRLNVTGTMTIHSPAYLDDPGEANLIVGVADTFPFPLVSGAYALMTVNAATPGDIVLVGDFADSNVALPASMSIKTTWDWDIETAWDVALQENVETRRTLKIAFEQMPFANAAGLAGKYLTAAGSVDKVHTRALTDTALFDAFRPLFDTLNHQPSILLYQEVLDQLTPSAYQAWFPSAVVRANSLVQNMEDRMYQDAAFKRKKGSVQMFLDGYRQEASRAGDDIAAYSNYGVIAAVAGIDCAIGENFVAGGFVACEKTDFDLDTAGGSCDVDSHTFGLNARYNTGRFQFNLTGFYGADDYKSSRSVALTRLATWADADTKGTRLGAAASIACTLNFPWFEFTPVAGAQWLSWKADGFQERNANETNLKIYDQNETSLQGKYGVRIARSFNTKAGMLRPFFHYAWLREFEGGNRTLSADLFGSRIDIDAPGAHENGWRMDIGVDWSASRKLRVNLRYHSEYRGAAKENVGARGGVTYSF
ncbi:MAG: autotransporter outer membrane beta-barrel domain-containing protein [Opitutaceae bacterium]|jgi:uncharacterized protein YhjY with autotransporter beta-barrel domain|nr:autotransporter outer membrane beta-barrel domain-containing protein [Opitutaceae bacterium]